MQAERNRKFAYAWNKTAFDAIDPATTDYVMGAFSQLWVQLTSDL